MTAVDPMTSSTPAPTEDDEVKKRPLGQRLMDTMTTRVGPDGERKWNSRRIVQHVVAFFIAGPLGNAILSAVHLRRDKGKEPPAPREAPPMTRSHDDMLEEMRRLEDADARDVAAREAERAAAEREAAERAAAEREAAARDAEHAAAEREARASEAERAAAEREAAAREAEREAAEREAAEREAAEREAAEREVASDDVELDPGSPEYWGTEHVEDRFASEPSVIDPVDIAPESPAAELDELQQKYVEQLGVVIARFAEGKSIMTIANDEAILVVGPQTRRGALERKFPQMLTEEQLQSIPLVARDDLVKKLPKWARPTVLERFESEDLQGFFARALEQQGLQVQRATQISLQPIDTEMAR